MYEKESNSLTLGMEDYVLFFYYVVSYYLYRVSLLRFML